jgi:hypothetical protein
MNLLRHQISEFALFVTRQTSPACVAEPKRRTFPCALSFYWRFLISLLQFSSSAPPCVRIVFTASACGQTRQSLKGGMKKAPRQSNSPESRAQERAVHGDEASYLSIPLAWSCNCTSPSSRADARGARSAPWSLRPRHRYMITSPPPGETDFSSACKWGGQCAAACTHSVRSIALAGLAGFTINKFSVH